MWNAVLRFLPWIFFVIVFKSVTAKEEVIVGVNDYDRSGGVPVGMQPYCPGVTKPSSVSEDYINKHYSVVVQNGWNKKKNNMYRKRYFYKTAAEEVARDRNVDFKNKKTMIFLSESPLNTNLDAGYEASKVFSKAGFNALSISTKKFTHERYPVTARLSRLVGNITSLFLRDLMDRGLNPEDLILVGGSLGAHMAGFAGKYFYRLTGKKIGHIMAIDPIGLCFRYADPEDRLNATDADFVQVFHSNMYGYGMEAPMGHVDFYLNGGLFQYSWFAPFPCLCLCSHVKAYKYFYYIIKHPGKFIGSKCDSIRAAKLADCFKGNLVTNAAGVDIDKNVTGIFFLPTLHVKPYYVPKNHLVGDVTSEFLNRLNKNETLIIDVDYQFGYDYSTDVPPAIIDEYKKDHIAFKKDSERYHLPQVPRGLV